MIFFSATANRVHGAGAPFAVVAFRDRETLHFATADDVSSCQPSLAASRRRLTVSPALAATREGASPAPPWSAAQRPEGGGWGVHAWALTPPDSQLWA